jgi:succinate-acetate transporter protein
MTGGGPGGGPLGTAPRVSPTAATRQSSDGAATRPHDGPVRIFLRPVGTPIAIGLGAIAIGTTMLSAIQFGWLTTAQEQHTVAYVALGAAFPLELLAAIFALLARDALAGTGLAIFSSIWSVTGLTLLNGPPGATNDALGIFMLVGAALLLLLLLSAGRARIVFGAMIITGCARLTVSGLYEIKGTAGLKEAAAIVGMALAAVCAYGIVALLMEDMPRRALLPVGRSGRAAASLAGGLGEQLEDVENEAGVRRQL